MSSVTVKNCASVFHSRPNFFTGGFDYGCSGSARSGQDPGMGRTDQRAQCQRDDDTKRSKELLAYLVNKEGILCPTSEICNIIFRGSSDSYLRVAKKDLKAILRDIGKGDVLVSGWGVLGINRKEVRCDYFDYLDGKPGALNLYKGAYMSQYEWARGKVVK